MMLRLLFGVTVCLAVLTSSALGGEVGVKKYRVYIGTYTGPKSKGIYRCELDLATGKLSEPTLAGETRNPSFLAIHPDMKHLYAVSEVSDAGGKMTGAVAAFEID